MDTLTVILIPTGRTLCDFTFFRDIFPAGLTTFLWLAVSLAADAYKGAMRMSCQIGLVASYVVVVFTSRASYDAFGVVPLVTGTADLQDFSSPLPYLVYQLLFGPADGVQLSNHPRRWVVRLLEGVLFEPVLGVLD
jgi:hypothetical protein